jgi:hypothetical protein
MIKSSAHLEQKVYSDGKMIENKDITMNYDGEKMAIDVRENGHKKHMVLTKDDIMDVFSRQAHDTNLMSRLKLDFKTNSLSKKKHAASKKKHAASKKKHAASKKKRTNKKTKSSRR